MKKVETFFFVLLVCANTSFASEINLKNGDKITGTIIEETSSSVTIETEALGTVTIDKQYMKSFMTAEVLEAKKMAAKKEEQEWKRSVSVGYAKSGGNDEDANASATIKADRKTDENEMNFKLSAFYDENDNEIKNREFYGSGRYAYSFGEEDAWFHAFKLEWESDYAANVDYRITPSTGIGYWFADKDNFKAKAELALGYEDTHYRDGTKSEGEVVFIPSGYLEKMFDNGLKLSEELTLYPSLEETGEFRLKSETAIAHPLNNRASVKLSFIEEHDSDPKGGARKDDYKVITSLDYNF